VKNSRACDLLENDGESESESDSDVIRVSVREDGSQRPKVSNNRGNGFWEVEGERVEGSSSDSVSVEVVEDRIQVDIHQEEAGDKSDSDISGTVTESEEDNTRWVAGKSLRQRTEKVKPVSYGMVVGDRLKSIFDDSETDECDLSRFVDPRDF
jgi:hypothetical protein